MIELTFEFDAREIVSIYELGVPYNDMASYNVYVERDKSDDYYVKPRGSDVIRIHYAPNGFYGKNDPMYVIVFRNGKLTTVPSNRFSANYSEVKD